MWGGYTGDYNKARRVNQVEVFDLLTEMWLKHATFLPGYNNGATASVGGYGYVFNTVVHLISELFLIIIRTTQLWRAMLALAYRGRD